MIILNSLLFKRYPEIIFGFSTKKLNDSSSPYAYNLSYSVGDEEKTVKKNREQFYNSLDLKKVVTQNQIHGDKISVVSAPGEVPNSDALVTELSNLGLAVSVADCVAVFIYDYKNKLIAAVHSGWRGTNKKILEKVLRLLNQKYDTKPENLVAYISPSISQKNYEVGSEVAELFDSKYLKPIDEKFFLDVAAVNRDVLINFGVDKNNIQLSSLCTYENKELLHSYRRDGKRSGRNYGIIAMKGNSDKSKS